MLYKSEVIKGKLPKKRVLDLKTFIDKNWNYFVCFINDYKTPTPEFQLVYELVEISFRHVLLCDLSETYEVVRKIR